MPRTFTVVAGTALLLATASWPAVAQTKRQPPVPALYASRAEAERAAHLFGCSGAHPMGEAWMPCAKHPSPAKPHYGQH